MKINPALNTRLNKKISSRCENMQQRKNTANVVLTNLSELFHD